MRNVTMPAVVITTCPRTRVYDAVAHRG